jgi:hypothetical protein
MIDVTFKEQSELTPEAHFPPANGDPLYIICCTVLRVQVVGSTVLRCRFVA